MAHYRASESKREQFRRYLEKAGVLDSLTNVLVALYEETEKPNNALDFIKHHLGVSGVEAEDAESLREELNTLQQKHQQLMEENQELKSRLLQYEPPQDEAAAVE
ncbi:C-Myc-binding protein [Danio rerio]|uniref:Zgc:136962 n=1 Tax=Danio rerio TaxID=7955 RepID=Q24JV0_DANRE|nr:C-Myc-binding protein [Danio rerio]AAI14324.1 Zgc:136962 [Danio rerio]|eukprot:NP_001035140.1 C-Myc-binding protein [Danio rerio]